MVGKIPKKNEREGVDEYGRTKLHYSSTASEIEKLIDDGFDINHQDDNGWCPLHFFSQDRNTPAVEAALNKGANPNLIDLHGNGPLWTATMNAKGEYEVVALLLKNGADPNLRNKHGRSPFDMANTIKSGLEVVFTEAENN